MRGNETPFWPADWADPSRMRAVKPRRTGLTMVIDKGIGTREFHDLLELAGEYIDVYKLGFGTSALYPVPILQEKLELARAHHVTIMPGGTFYEVACQDAPVESYLARLQALGFNGIEISDGTLSISRDERTQAIARAAESGLTVFTEYGKKTAGFQAEVDELAATLEADLAAGASYVIVEARESGNVGVYDRQGEVDSSFLSAISSRLGSNANRLIWEAPRKEQQVALLTALGLDVNLGNIAATDVLALEALRRGLRGDTTRLALEGRSKPACE